MRIQSILAALLLAAPLLSAASELDITRAMAAGHAGDRPVATPAATTAPVQAVETSIVSYATIEGESVRGFLARPAGVQGPLPAIIVIHEWWGLNDNIRDMTRRLAGEGYIALAVDLYRGQVADNVRVAMALSQALAGNMATADENLRQAYAWLDETAGASRVAAIGWCLGGRWALRTALLFPDELAAGVIYYGSVRAEPEELATLDVPLLGIFAELDRVVPVDQVEAFEAQMNALGKLVDIHIYPGVDHAFANPSGGAYNAEADADAWGRTVSFLAQHLAQD
ncbi:MAG: dienelactone hydrolase family protein [Chromatiales bacterium]|nr:dienelactone hydrolase family protein [Chromatiales bacterium]